MQFLRERPWYAEANRTRLTVLAGAWIVAVAVVDWATRPYLELDYLYLFALVLASPFLSRWQVAILAYICAVLQDAFAYFPLGPERLPHAILAFLAYALVGLVIRELVVYRRAAAHHLRKLERDLSRRHEAEEQLQILINSSPAGIVTVSSDGKIVLSNEAAHRIFGVPPGALSGLPINSFLPGFQQVQETQASSPDSAAVECHGQRANGEKFVTYVAVSRFACTAGPMMGAMILQVSEHPSRYEEAGLRTS